ncbi:MAG: thiosulfate reductase/polysulfide reductase chain A [Sulfurimonas sp.]|jgi:thiosulfate reductase/polysulfide reductase chain A
MKVEVSRRKFLQGSVAMSVVTATALSTTSLLSNEDTKDKKAGQISFKNTKTQDVEAREVATLCEMCVNKCAALARVENGVITKLNPNPIFPKSRNMLCARGNAGIQAVYDPDRLKFPMIRIGEKGEGKFKRVTWDEANEAILNGTDKFTGLKTILEEEKDNRSSMMFCAGEGMAEHTFKQFFQAFGSANWLNHSSLCLQTVASGYGITIGAYPQADLDNAEYIIMAGANRAEAIVTPDTMDAFKRTKGRGAELICVDPRFSNTAAKADKWLAIKPGTDLAFVLALTYVTLTEDLENKQYVKDNFNSFDEYKESIISNKYTPEWAEPLTGIKAKDIYKIARDFAAHAPKAIYYPGRRSTFAQNDFQLRRAMAIFQALHAGIDTKGGLIFGRDLPMKAHAGLLPLYEQAKARAKKHNHTEGEPGYPDAAIIPGGGSWINWRNNFLEDNMDYKVRGMFCYKHNPMMNTPNSAKTAEMLKKMELVVCIDTMPGDTVMYADVVLPECTYLERTDPIKTFAGIEPSIAVRNKVIEPMFESKPVIEILKGLTTKISKPLFDISKKFDSEIQDMIEENGEEKTYAEFDLTLPFIHTQEELNHHAVAMYLGASEQLDKHGVFYPKMDRYFKQLGANKFQYYPENKKSYSMFGGKPKTPSGKVECKIASFAKKGIDPMPIWNDEYEFSVPNGKFKLLTGRHAQFTQTSTGNNAMLRDLMPENFIWINKRVAKERDINFGDMIEVSSTAGKTQIKAYPTEKVAPNQVFFVHGFGHESSELTWAYKNGGSDNAVIEDRTEPVFGAAVMHETNIEIRKV